MLPPLLTLIITHFTVFLPSPHEKKKKDSVTGSRNNKEYIKTSHSFQNCIRKVGILNTYKE